MLKYTLYMQIAWTRSHLLLLLIPLNGITRHSHKQSPWFSHKSTPHTQVMCLFANRIFVLSSQKHLGINLQVANTVFEKTPLPCHEAYSAGVRSVLICMRIRVFAHACVMYARISIFGVPWRSSFATTKRKISGTSIKIGGNEGG